MSILTYLANHVQLKMSLQFQESRISRQYMCINPLAPDDWYATIDAIFKIKNEKLFSPKYKSLNFYLQEKWKHTSRATFNNIAISGRVVSELKKARFKDLPANVATCLAIASASIKHQRSVIQVWNLALDKYKSSKNVISSHISSMYQQPPSPTTTTNTYTESTIHDSEAEAKSIAKDSESIAQDSDSEEEAKSIAKDSDSDAESEPGTASFRKRKLSTISSAESEEEEIGSHDRYNHIRKNGRPVFAENGKSSRQDSYPFRISDTQVVMR